MALDNVQHGILPDMRVLVIGGVAVLLVIITGYLLCLVTNIRRCVPFMLLFVIVLAFLFRAIRLPLTLFLFFLVYALSGVYNMVWSFWQRHRKSGGER